MSEEKPILKALESRISKEKPNTKLWIMAIAVVLLIVVSGVQAVELATLKTTVSTEITALGASPVSAGGSGSPNTNLQSNIQNLPTMVGGC